MKYTRIKRFTASHFHSNNTVLHFIHFLEQNICHKRVTSL